MTMDEAYRDADVPPDRSQQETTTGDPVPAQIPQLVTDGGVVDQTKTPQETDEALSHSDLELLLKAADEQTEAADSDEGEANDPEGAEGEPTFLTVRFVRDLMVREDIEVLFDGSLRRISAPTMATSPDEISAFLALEDVDGAWLIDELMDELRARELNYTKGDIERAVRRITREDRRARRNAIVLPLLMPAPGDKQVLAAAAWLQLTDAIFEANAVLAAACLQHFIWQVKQKLLGRPVKHHLMPVVYSPVQGSGKTTFLLKFLAPLRELATGPVLLSDFADKRSADIYRFPALFIDDMEQIERSMIPVLKSLVTSEGFRRRRLGTSMSEGHRQRTTLIGTANSAIDTLVADETGNRRFASLLFRNGQVAKGGDAGVWPAVEAADYGLLWRSVDTFGPGPIEAHLDALIALQEAARPKEPLLAWLRALDVAAKEMVAITTRDGVQAKQLFELFRDRTNSTLSNTEFGIRMKDYALDPTVPFGPKAEKSYGNVYPLKARSAAVI